MKTKSILILIAAVALAACGGKSAKTSADGQQAEQQQTQSAEDAFKSECQKTIQQVNGLQRKLADPQQYTTQQGVEELQWLVDELSLNNNAAELDSAELALAQQVNALISDVKQQMPYKIQQNVCNTPHTLISKPEELLTETAEYPLYLERGDKLMLNIETEKPADMCLPYHCCRSPGYPSPPTGSTTDAGHIVGHSADSGCGSILPLMARTLCRTAALRSHGRTTRHLSC